MVLLQPAGLGASCGSAVPEAKSSVLVLVSSGHVLGISRFELGLSAVSILLPSIGASRVHIKLCLGQSPAWLVLLPVPPTWLCPCLGGPASSFWWGRTAKLPTGVAAHTGKKFPVLKWKKHNFQTWLAR